MPRILIDLTGRTFGRLTVTGIAETRRRSNRAEWLCTCSCGGTHQAAGVELVHGRVKSCGCLRRENYINVLMQARQHRGMRAAARKALAVKGHEAAQPVSKRANDAPKQWRDAEDAAHMLNALLR